MNRYEFFLAAMAAGEYRRAAWVISAFSMVLEGPQDWKADPYPYRIVQLPTGFFFVNPQNTAELLAITDATAGQPLYRMKERVQAKEGDIPNLKQSVETSYGNLLFNCIALVYAFGDKISYVEGKVSAAKIEALIVERLRDTPPEGAERDPAFIYVDEYLRFTDGMFSLMAYTQLCVPACTEKTITAPPGVIELRTRLLEENKGRLHDPAVIAKIDAVLVKYLKDWLKDDPGMGFLIYDKSFSNVRRKLYLMGGAEVGMDDKVEIDLVVKSLSEGWEPEKFATMNTASRAGSFSRGAQTELGGEAVKWLFRASSNMTVTEADCKSDMGVQILARPGEENKLLGFTALLRGEQLKITRDNVDQYLGKVITLRSPMYCRLPKTDFCATCLGDKLASSPTGLSTAVAEYGSTFMSIMLKIMHSTELKLAKMHYQDALI